MFLRFLPTCFVGGLLVILPLWLTILLVGGMVTTIRGALHPFAGVLLEGLAYPDLISFLILLLLCFVAGAFIQTQLAKSIGMGVDGRVLSMIPGYRLVRSLLHRLMGEHSDQTWAVALVEIEEALMPGFVVEELPDGQYTVFVPSVPTPAAGAVYIIEARRVHIIDIPFPQAIQCIAQWGAGSSKLLAALNAAQGRS
jgi:uncharacterized membrane protein